MSSEEKAELKAFNKKLSEKAIKYQETNDSQILNELLESIEPTTRQVYYRYKSRLIDWDADDVYVHTAMCIQKQLEMGRYTPERGQFLGWVYVICRGETISHCIHQDTQKHAPLNKKVHIEGYGDGKEKENQTYEGVDDRDPARLHELSDEFIHVMTKLSIACSLMEQLVLYFYLNQLPYVDIAEKINLFFAQQKYKLIRPRDPITAKVVDNTLVRVKIKAKKVDAEYNMQHDADVIKRRQAEMLSVVV